MSQDLDQATTAGYGSTCSSVERHVSLTLSDGVRARRGVRHYRSEAGDASSPRDGIRWVMSARTYCRTER